MTLKAKNNDTSIHEVQSSGNVCTESTRLKQKSNCKFVTHVHEQICLREKEEANLKFEMKDTPIHSLHFSVQIAMC